MCFYIYGLYIVDVIIGALSPTLNYEGGQIASFPIAFSDNHLEIENIVKDKKTGKIYIP